jgi:hypothetical protein
MNMPNRALLNQFSIRGLCIARDRDVYRARDPSRNRVSALICVDLPSLRPFPVFSNTLLTRFLPTRSIQCAAAAGEAEGWFGRAALIPFTQDSIVFARAVAAPLLVRRSRVARSGIRVNCGFGDQDRPAGEEGESWPVVWFEQFAQSSSGHYSAPSRWPSS